jgi:1-aminocyclopropane-1-carboxylate deaminase/D-cysteine desulfhydrase-like pyridoxal-dependent ACC family enzyme
MTLSTIAADVSSVLAARAPFGRYPTPVEPLPRLSNQGCELWVKRDDLTHPVYGGNKVRKLDRILAALPSARAPASRPTRLVTIGAAGSHHVLATAYFGGQAGFAVEAALFPQPGTVHAREVLGAGLALGCRVFPARSVAGAALLLAARVVSGARWIPPGGSNVAGAMGYVQAGLELAEQVKRGALPEPDLCFVALGSGGTAAGLAAGFAAAGMKTRVVGVCILTPPWAARLAARLLLARCLRQAEGIDRRAGHRALTLDERFVGRGYGYATVEGDEAARLAAEHAGLTLDPTYTAKTFAAALAAVRARSAPRILYWHTLSSAPMGPLLAGHAPPATFDPSLERLFLPPFRG